MATAPSLSAATYFREYRVTLSATEATFDIFSGSFFFRDLNRDGKVQGIEVIWSDVEFGQEEGLWIASDGWLTINQIPIGTTILSSIHGSAWGWQGALRFTYVDDEPCYITHFRNDDCPPSFVSMEWVDEYRIMTTSLDGVRAQWTLLNPQVIPVPAALPLLATALAGLAGLAAIRRRRTSVEGSRRV